MAALNPMAKRIHAISPGPVALTLEDGTELVVDVSGAEFFQQEFQAEGVGEDGETSYRFVTSEDNESVLLGRKRVDGAGWESVGAVVEAADVE